MLLASRVLYLAKYLYYMLSGPESSATGVEAAKTIVTISPSVSILIFLGDFAFFLEYL